MPLRTVECARCDGNGAVHIDRKLTPERCPRCRGTGHVKIEVNE